MSTSERDFDVVVVGAGGGGLAAALSASENGARVLLVDAATQTGGSTALSGGAFLAAATRVQEQAGIFGDSAAEMYDYFVTVNRWDVDPANARRFCEGGASAVDWLMSHGVVFPPADLARGERERFPRMHRAEGGGAGITSSLTRACSRQGIDMALGTRVDDLLIEDGVVVGVRAGDEEVTAHSVVIASGGFARNAELIKRHLPFTEQFADDLMSPAPSTNQGDGLTIALRAGAATAGENRAQVLLSSGIVSDIEPVLPGWLICVDKNGRRFVDETSPYHITNPLTIQHGGICWAVFDDAALRAAKGSGSRFGNGLWVADVLAQGVQEGKIASAPDVRSLADAVGLPSAVLETTIAGYNADVQAGEDSQFFKSASGLVPCETGPFYAVALRPLIMPSTGFGVRTDADGRVLRASDDQPIPGLFAVGEVVGNVMGPHVFGGGSMIAAAVIFGRQAGEVAAASRAVEPVG